MQRAAAFIFLAIVSWPSAAHAEPATQVRPVAVASVPQFDVALEARRTRLAASVKPAVLPKLDGAIKDVRKRAEPQIAPPGKPVPPVADLAAVARTFVAELARAESIDVETLVLLVLAEAAKDADRDLRAVLVEVKAANERKAAMRAALAALKASREATKSTKACASLACLDALPQSVEYTQATMATVKRSVLAIAEAKREDSLTEASTLEEVRLQLMMDRRAKYVETLSNLLKKLNETAQAITQNLK